MSARVTLTVTEGQLKGEQFPFDFPIICVIGRSPDCNIQIPNDSEHETVSRYHCLLDINPPDIRIRDFGSRNGTKVNGKCIGKRGKNQTPLEGAKLNFSEHSLQDGDLIKLGNTVFQVSIQLESDVLPTFIIEEKDLTSSPDKSDDYYPPRSTIGE